MDERSYSPRRRGTTLYSTWPADNSSIARVVSFFSRTDDVSWRGSSLSTRAYFAAMRTPRYLLAELEETSSGVKTRMIPLVVRIERSA